MSEELKPVRCGCGGEAEAIVLEDYETNKPWHIVQCNKCKIETDEYRTKSEAITAWNKAMDAKDINVPNKFATDINVGNKTAKFKQDGEFLRCGKCNHIVDSGYKYCPKCGSRLEFE